MNRSVASGPSHGPKGLYDMECNETEDCTCSDCVKARADFNAWVANTEQRWAKAYADGKVAHLCGSPCRNPLCPKHGDPRDTSVIAYFNRGPRVMQ